MHSDIMVTRRVRENDFSIRQVETQNLLDNFGEVSFSAGFVRHKGFFSNSLNTQSNFSCEHHFLAAVG